MKNFLFVCVAIAAGLLLTNTSKAQAQKIGWFDEVSTLSLFPGLQGKVDTLMYNFQNDSLGVEYNYTYGDYVRRDSIFKKDSASMPAKARELAVREINQLKAKLVNWQQYAQQMSENKQEQILFPYKQKIYNAMQEIIKEQKYTYVLNAQSIAVQYAQPPILDNLSIRIAMRLKLPLSKEIEDAWKAASGTGAPASAPKK